MEELSVSITGDISGLRDSLNEAETAVRNSSNRIEDSADGITSSLNNTAPAARNTSTAVRSLGRELLNTSSAGGAMTSTAQTLTSALGGSGGVGVAVGLLVAGVGLLVDHYREAAEEQSAFNRALTQGVAAAQSEAETLGALLRIAQDVTASQETRLGAIEDINREYGDYLPNITQENINTQAVTRSIDLYTNSLLRNARIKAAQNLITEEFSRILDIQAQDAISSANGLDILAAAFGSFGNAATIGTTLSALGFRRQNEEISEAEERIERLRGLLQNLLVDDIDFGVDPIEPIDPRDLLPENTFVDLSDIFQVNSDNLTGVFVDPVRAELDRLGILLDQAPAMVTPRLSNFEQTLQDFNTRLNNIFSQDSVASSIQSFSQQIGQGIASGASFIDTAGQALVGLFGGFLSQLGNLLIEYGTLSVVKGNLDLAIAAGGPLAIGAGLAAIAVGAALSAAGSALSNAASGGFSGGAVGGQGSQQRFTGSTASFSSSQGFDGGTVVFEIAYDKLRGVLDQGDRNRGRING